MKQLVFFVCLGLLALLAACRVVEPATTPAQVSEGGVVEPSEAGAGLDGYQEQRNLMLRALEMYGIQDQAVLRAMGATPRHAFVPESYLAQAYADHPLPIGYGQTISQPYIVAWMTELLELKAGMKVLEIGTGSGYQAAILAEIGEIEVYSIEIVPELAASAAAVLEKLGYSGVQVRQGDGYFGWEEHAPFDAIIVTAAPDHLPAPLAAQLKPGGVLVIPIGPPGGYQSLWKFVNAQDGLKAYNMGGVRFVPFTGEGIRQGEGAP